MRMWKTKPVITVVSAALENIEASAPFDLGVPTADRGAKFAILLNLVNPERPVRAYVLKGRRAPRNSVIWQRSQLAFFRIFQGQNPKPVPLGSELRAPLLQVLRVGRGVEPIEHPLEIRSPRQDFKKRDAASPCT